MLVLLEFTCITCFCIYCTFNIIVDSQFQHSYIYNKHDRCSCWYWCKYISTFDIRRSNICCNIIRGHVQYILFQFKWNKINRNIKMQWIQNLIKVHWSSIEYLFKVLLTQLTCLNHSYRRCFATNVLDMQHSLYSIVGSKHNSNKTLIFTSNTEKEN